MSTQFTKPAGLVCEAPHPTPRPATHIYGPECEAETGQLMYLCKYHAQLIRDWAATNWAEPVECPTHGRIGIVKNYLILKEIL